MPGLVPGIHVFLPVQQSKTWMAGTSPAMTKECPRASANVAECYSVCTSTTPGTALMAPAICGETL
jgi:hypothetical protein